MCTCKNGRAQYRIPHVLTSVVYDCVRRCVYCACCVFLLWCAQADAPWRMPVSHDCTAQAIPRHSLLTPQPFSEAFHEGLPSAPRVLCDRLDLPAKEVASEPQVTEEAARQLAGVEVRGPEGCPDSCPGGLPEGCAGGPEGAGCPEGCPEGCPGGRRVARMARVARRLAHGVARRVPEACPRGCSGGEGIAPRVKAAEATHKQNICRAVG